MEGPDFKTFRIVCIYNLAFLTILPKLLYQNFISNITLTFWEDPLQTTTCGTSKSLESNSLSSFSLKKSWRISREEQCGLMRLKCVAYGSLQRVLSVLRKQQGDNHLTLTITNMLFNFCFYQLKRHSLFRPYCKKKNTFRVYPFKMCNIIIRLLLDLFSQPLNIATICWLY